MERKTSPLRGSVLLLLTAAIWGVAFVAQSVGMDYVGGFTFNSVRSLIGALVLLPVMLFLDHREPRSKAQSAFADRTLLTGGAVCGVFLCLASNCQQFGIKYSTVGKAGFITALYIVLVPIFGLFLKKKCGRFIWTAVVVALAGLYLLCMLVSGVKLSMMQFLICGIGSGIPALLFEHPEISQILAAWKPVLYAGVLSCGVAYTLQIIGQRDLNPTIASLIMSLESCISVLAGWMILHQTLSLREITGCAVMFAAIILAQLPSPSR